MNTLRAKLDAEFPMLTWQYNVPLAPFTYMKIGGPAEALVTVSDPTLFRRLQKYCHEQDIPLTILGGASNVIVSDKGVAGIVVRMAFDVIEKKETTEDGITIVRAGAGAKMAPLVAKTVSWGLTGLEYFLGVPGTLGGAIYNNAHYLQDLIGEHVLAVHAVAPDGTTQWIPAKECEFAYEHSRFQTSNEIILEVDFALKAGDPQKTQAMITHATEYRANTQPLGIPSSGCIFQNVPNTNALKKTFPDFAQKEFVPGGYIIDQAGLKNTRVGGIRVSQKHAAWFENDGTGTSQDVKDLIKIVKNTVKEKYKVELHEEVFYLE